MLFAILEIGLLLNAKLALSSSAREIARLCSVEGGYTAKVSQTVPSILDAAGLTPSSVTVKVEPKQAIYGTTIRVNLECNYAVKSPLISIITGSRLTVTAKAVTRSEFVPR